MKFQLQKKLMTAAIIFLLTVLWFVPLASAYSVTINQKTVEDLSMEGLTSQESKSYDLLIISPGTYTSTLQPLVDHKNSFGVKTKLVTLDEVYDSEVAFWYGRDNPEKIKYFIKSAIEEWNISYVMLVGNFRQMPIRYVYNDEPSEGFSEPNFISELYYADIYDQNGNFSSWDTNNNGVFGEWKGEEAQDRDIDLYPDVYVGRLAARNSLELNVVVNKIITYETNTYDQDWFKKIVVVAGDTYPDGYYDFPTPFNEGEENAKTVLSYLPGFENTSLFTSDGTLKGPRDVIKTINQGCGFLFFDGHASPMSWSTHKPNNDVWVDGLSTFTMNRLINYKKLPVCVVGGCHNMQFDVNLFNLLKNPIKSYYYSTWAPECWGWKLTSKIGGGSIATIGCSGLGMTKEDKSTLEGASDYLDSQFFYEYGINGTEMLGKVWGNAITNYLDKYPIDWNTRSGWDFAYDAKTVQQWVLMGDPSLKIGGYPSS